MTAISAAFRLPALMQRTTSAIGSAFRAGLVTTGLLAVMVSAAASEEDGFQQQLELAIELNLTAPWQESQAILDRIEAQLDQATPDQFATFQLLRIRNLALAGKFVEGLELTRDLLQQSIPEEHQLAALARGANLGLLGRRFEEAFHHLYQGLMLEPEVNDPELTTYIYSMAAEVFRTVGKVDQAIEYAQHSVSVAREHALERPACVAKLRLAIAYRAGDHFSEAMEHFDMALSQCRQANDPIFIAIAETGRGHVLQRKGQLDEAERVLERALEQHRQNGYRSGEFETLLFLAHLYQKTDRDQRAEAILADLIDEFTNAERWDLLATTHKVLGKITSGRGDHARALEHVLGEINARERFLDVERTLKLAYLEIEFETLHRNQQLSLLHQQRRVSKLQEQTRVQQRRLNAMAYASGGFLTVILLLLLIRARRERRHFQRLSGLDSLTGLSNHTRFFDAARQMVQEAERNGLGLVMAIGDIDHFKQVNDTHGHLAGDEALRKVGRALSDLFTESAQVGRIGGEEFALCLSGKSIDETNRLLEELRGKLRQIDYGGEGRPLTISFGLARLQPDESLGRLRQRADEALYQAKSAGRDIVIVAAPDQ